MSRRFLWLIVFMVIISLVTMSCSGGTTSTSIDGAKLEVGYEVDDDFRIISPRTHFAIEEDFRISFEMNEPFNADVVVFRIYEAETGELYGEATVNVDPQYNILATDPVYVEDPGKYNLQAVVNGKVKATQDIIITENSGASANETPASSAGTGEIVIFNETGISFTFPASLAARAIPGFVEEYIDQDYISHPEYLKIVFENYIHSDAFETPVLRLFVTEEYTIISEYASSQINDLKKYISDFDSIREDRELPFLPNPMAGQQFYSNAIPINFQNGKGIRYLTQYIQDTSPVTNDGLFYTFQGLTDDGQTYVSFTMPVTHSELPADWDDFFNTYEVTYETFGENYREYLNLVIDLLHESEDEMFTPSLKVLDEIVMSLQID